MTIAETQTHEGLRVLRRSLDFLFATLALLLASPMLAICAVLIKLDSKGPVLFWQPRVGVGMKDFRVVKLRTMIQDAERLGQGLYTEPGDSRFTRVGLFLRRWSLDELPQLFNVMAGTMSIVGPRPLPREVVDRYPEDFAEILRVKPGLTGYSQIRGRSAVPRSERLRMDRYYARHRTVWMDLAIILRTIPVVLAGTGQVNHGREDCVFRAMGPTDSEGRSPPIPREEAHPFRGMRPTPAGGEDDAG